MSAKQQHEHAHKSKKARAKPPIDPENWNPYGWFGPTFKSQIADLQAVPPEIRKGKGATPQNLIQLDRRLLRLIAKRSSIKSKKMAAYFLESIVPIQLAFEASTEFGLTVLKDGLKTDAGVTPDVEYVLQWLLVQAMTVRFIRMLKLPRSVKNELRALWLDKLTTRAVTNMKSTIGMPNPRSLDHSNTKGNVTSGGSGSVTKRSDTDDKPRKKARK